MQKQCGQNAYFISSFLENVHNFPIFAYFLRNKIIENNINMKKPIIISAFLAASALFANAQETPMWVRQHSISPDGSTIAFSYKGDIFTVSANGGEARQLTSHNAYDSAPVWSPDGTKIAFASDREGSMDVYVMSAKGGAPKRLTYTAGKETPLAFKDNETVLFQSSIRPTVKDMQFASAQFSQVYQVSVNGGRPTMATSWTMENVSVSSDGSQWLYTDKKGYEDAWRKHHTSSITRDIWLYDVAGKSFKKLTDYNGEDRNAVWGDNGDYYYLSERNGSFNVYKNNIKGGSAKKLTSFDKHPVRFLSRANNGVMSFSYDGELYTMTEGAAPKKVVISVVADNLEQDVIREFKSGGATSFAVSPDGKEIAFVVRGDVYVTSVDYKTTKQITDTPEQERNVDFAPDGKALVYSAERNGVWQIYQSKIVRKDEKLFTYATEIKEECLTKNNITSFYPKYSPDGKEVAYLENRTAINIINLATGAIRNVMPAQFEYSYSDGDQYFCWSPDSRWLLSNYIGIGGWNNKDVALIKADGSMIKNLTESGYNDTNAKWVLGGKAMIWGSDRAGYRSHGSWGAEDDVYIMFFDVDAYEKFLMSKEEVALLEDAEKKDKDKDKDKKDDKAKDSKKKGKAVDEEKKEDVKPLVLDLENAKDRVMRLTVNSSRLGDALLDKKGEVLYYTASFEGAPDLWKHELKENKTSIVKKGVGRGDLLTDKDMKNIYISSRRGFSKMEMGKSDAKDISFEALFNYRPAQERAYIFDHIWRQVNEKFYDPSIRGIDWKGYHDAYEKFLPYINNNYDFQDLLSEFLGELNGSHTGARYYAPSKGLAVASLGLFYDETYTGKGLKIEEIIPKSELTKKKNDVVPGCIIETIDGVEVDDNGNESYLLAGKVGKPILLGVYNPATDKRFEVKTKGIGSGEETGLLYSRWVERNRKIVEEKTNGRIGYVHIKGMDAASFHTLYSEVLGRYRECDAIIVDTRHNGGGWLHDDVVTLLGAKEYTRYTPRGQYIGSDPFNKWTKPSCMLVCEDNYSNAHGTPWLYKELGIGQLIGTPVPGTMTAVWWETQIDPTIVFGIPQVGSMDNRGNYLENQQLYPDIEVYNRPEDVLEGKDAQLERAIQEMMQYVK